MNVGSVANNNIMPFDSNFRTLEWLKVIHRSYKPNINSLEYICPKIIQCFKHDKKFIGQSVVWHSIVVQIETENGLSIQHHPQSAQKIEGQTQLRPISVYNNVSHVRNNFFKKHRPWFFNKTIDKTIVYCFKSNDLTPKLSLLYCQLGF